MALRMLCVDGAKLLPTIIPAFSVDCVCFCHLLMTKQFCLCSKVRNTVAMKKVALNLVVLAG